MPGDLQPPQAAQARPEPSDQDKALVKDWFKRIERALKRHEEVFRQFEVNRRLLGGAKDGNNKSEASSNRVKANLHFANQAALIPQIYAKDPEFAVTPSARVGTDQAEVMKKFAATMEVVLHKVLVKDAKLKKRAKAMLRSTYPTAIGWWKVSWQETTQTDPIIAERLKDTQDNIQRLQAQRDALDDPSAGGDLDLQLGQLRQGLAGLQGKAEITVSRGLVVDFVMSEDLLILDGSIRAFGDYERSAALAQRFWFTKDKCQAVLGYTPGKAKPFTEQGGKISQNAADDKSETLYCIWEIWDQDTNTMLTLCEGEPGFCRAPQTPNWTGERWYPFFGLGFNEIDGRFYPMSDVELTDPLVKASNETLDDFVEDRRDSRPVNIARKGGSLTDDDLQRVRNRKGAEIILVEGAGGQPLSNDLFIGQLAKIDPQVYNTEIYRAYIEMIVGGGDAARGTVLKAKTATEAEILSQGLRGRSAERQDTFEDLLTEVGQYAAEILLRRMTLAEVQQIAGEDAVWPQMDIEDVFRNLTIEVKGGSTGRPDRLQEQDRWTKLLPVIKDALTQVAELRASGQEQLAQAVILLTKETLRRFEERLDIDQLLPPPAEGQPDAHQLMQEVQGYKQQAEALLQELQQARERESKGVLQASTNLATSANPRVAIPAFVLARQAVEAGEMPDVTQIPEPPPQPAPGDGSPDSTTTTAAEPQADEEPPIQPPALPEPAAPPA